MLSPRRAPGKPWVRAAGAWGRGWRPEARGWGWMGWGGVGTGGRAAGLGALVCGAGETGLPSTARSPTESPKDLVPGRPPAPSSPTPARPGSPGRVRPGRKQARCCLAHRACPGRCSPRPVSSQPPQRGEESAPLGERPVLAREQEVAGGGPRPGREGSPQFHDVLARAPGRKPTRGLGGSPRAWLGPGSQGAAEGRVQTMAGHGSHHTPPPRPPWPPRSPPPPLALAGPGRGTALGPPIHGGPRRP